MCLNMAGKLRKTRELWQNDGAALRQHDQNNKRFYHFVRRLGIQWLERYPLLMWQALDVASHAIRSDSADELVCWRTKNWYDQLKLMNVVPTCQKFTHAFSFASSSAFARREINRSLGLSAYEWGRTLLNLIINLGKTLYTFYFFNKGWCWKQSTHSFASQTIKQPCWALSAARNIWRDLPRAKQPESKAKLRSINTRSNRTEELLSLIWHLNVKQILSLIWHLNIALWKVRCSDVN